jgi:hypothetical protein
MMRKQQQPTKIKLPLKPSFLLGLLLGMTLMWFMVQRPTTTNETAAPSISDASKKPMVRSTVVTKEAPGWHPIHVFYGEKSGLQEDPSQEFYAQVHQDEVLLDLIGDNGYFIDLAANDAKEFSNTLVLERHGWNGLCIEPNPGYWYGLSHRKCTVVGALVGATKEQVKVKFRGVYGGIVGKMDDKLANRKQEPKTETEQRYTAPLSEVFSQFNVPSSIDYLSLDVEGAEYLIMKDFPFDKYQIKIMTVERPNDELRGLLEGKGFVFLKDLAWWGETLWAHKSVGLTPAHPKIAKIVTEERH